MFNQQQQLQQLQQQQLLQLLQQSPPQAPLPMAVSRGLPQQQPQQQLLNLQGANSASLLNGSVLQRALLLQQLQGLDQFAIPPASYDSSGLTMPTATLGNLRGYNLAAPNLTAPSLTPPQLATPNLQQFFPQATRQSLLGPPPVGVPMNPSQINLSGRTPQKQARTPSSTPPQRKDSSSQTIPVEDGSDPPEGSEEAVESRTNTPEDQDSPPCPDDITKEKRTLAPLPESCEASEPPAKRSKSSELPTEKGPPGQLQAKVRPRARATAPKQTQTPELLPEPPEARGPPPLQPRVPQIQAPVQEQTQPLTPPADAPVQRRLQRQAQTQTAPDHVGPQPRRKEAELQSQVPPQARPQPPRPVQLQKQAQTQTCPEAQPPEQPPRQAPGPPPGQPPDQTEGQPPPPPRVSVPASEPAPVPDHSAVLQTPPDKGDTGAGLEEALPEPGGAQVSVESQEDLTSGLDVGECEKRAREMLGVWGAGGSLKVTILQSSDSRAFSTVPVTPVPRAGDSASAAPAATSTPSKQTLQFFCYLCKANSSSQQEFQNHMSGAQHQQRLGEIQHMSQACLLSLLPVPRDVLEREDEEPPPRRWCNTCQVYYMGDLIQHRRTQDHKIAKQSLRPFCTVCNRYFKTPRKFVEHVKSQGHKDKAKELKMLEKEIAGQDEDHFITVDAVGCFEGDEEEEEEEEDEEEEIEVEEEFCKQVRSRDISIEEWKGSETYSPNTAYGVDFLVPVMGYICRICHKFYHSNSGAQLSHCKSLAHFENLQKYKKAKNPSPTSRPVSRRCAINARNALTALFTSGGRTPTQPSTQDTAKTPGKNASTTTVIQGPAQNASSSKKPSLVSTRNHHSLLHGHS
ncbi:cip1-interacting zinc finger protein isoform X1 [Leptonychotes weddellii]|uniref:Cip1-interacting zinc finger protein isoform X1 n=1 Tax=Leptonychotes weddellii TaxID=9713 RepID=A0A7F8RRF2_LEPWE|nr:cip1-interacting zinc finger protein isoform X1 [Leptonychotes weddellii]XP_030895845.1 cip1-interacting zinc finger protein isoform X1 [Leptonychotes weddellii]XP_030895846.1 cip1-interacting zinc finger protein isoform X1 [Leptonychotes weddellii]